MEQNWEITQELYERALALDSTFALAHAAMDDAHYFGRRNWQAALEEYGIALQGLPKVELPDREHEFRATQQRPSGAAQPAGRRKWRRGVEI